MRLKRQPAYERFAMATDELVRGGPAGQSDAELEPVVALGKRLLASSLGAAPDPAFVDGLREELRQRAGTARGSGLRYALIDSPIGRLGLAYRGGKVVYCAALETGRGIGGAGVAAFERAVAQALGSWPERAAAPPATIERAVLRHLEGKQRFRALDLSWLTPFQQQVLEKTAEIPRGEVRPYGWVAREIGSPNAVRAVGTALGHNPVPFLVPCHRVVRSDWSLGEYSGGGPAVKERILALEGVPMADLQSGPRYHGSRTTHIVCYPACHAARRVRAEYAMHFASLREAQARGYRPCKLCRPA